MTNELRKAVAFKNAYGRLHGNPMDRDWNVWSAAWDAAKGLSDEQIDLLDRFKPTDPFEKAAFRRGYRAALGVPT